MTALDQDELVSIGHVVAQLQKEFPDVTPSSLRFLEREGLIQPERTPGGHRLYSQANIDTVRRIKEWQRDRLSLSEIRERLEALDTLPAHEEIARRFVEMAAEGDTLEARRTILMAFEAGIPLHEIYGGILRPALYDVGQRWESGAIGVGQEHEISAVVRDIIGEMASHTTRPSDPAGTILAACVAGEFHDLGLRMVSHLLEADGYAVHFLGANVPTGSIIDGIAIRRATIVLLSVTIDDNLPGLFDALDAINNLPASSRPDVFAGGQALAGHEDEIEERGAQLIASHPLGSASLGTSIATLLNS